MPKRFRKRAAHYYTGKDRVTKGAQEWADGNIKGFGQLMFESANSSFNQQETGIPEMKTIFDILHRAEMFTGLD